MWPTGFTELKEIEDFLICGICYDYMDTSVMTPCSHNYCSRCIRTYLHYKTQCPTCFEQIFEKDLRVNKAISGIILYFSQIKQKLLKCILGCNQQDVHTDKVCTDIVSPEHRLDESVKNIKEEQTDLQEPNITPNNSLSSDNVTPPKNVCSASTSASKIPAMFTPKSKKDGKVVPCPVCKVCISQSKINRHLDECLKRDTRKEEPLRMEPKRKPLVKLVFHLMKDVEIRRKLKEHGLPTNGQRKILETRLQRYTTLYNAECDKSNPRSVAELIKQCEEEESVENRVSKGSSSVNRGRKNIADNLVEEERRKYLEANKESFAMLISRIKNVGNTKKPPARRSLLQDVNNEANISVTEGCSKMNDNSGRDTSFKFDTISQDSDSNATCPLQMYSSEDPMKFLSVEISSSSESESNDGKLSADPDAFDGQLSPVLIDQQKSRSPLRRKRKTASSNPVSNTDKNLGNTPKSSKVPTFATALRTPLLKCELDNDNIVEILDRYDSNDTLCDNARTDMARDQRNTNTFAAQPSMLEDLTPDVSNNDDFDRIYKYELDHTMLDNRFVDVKPHLQVEKENISSIEKTDINYSLRKRTHDSIVSDGKTVKSKRSVQKSVGLSTDKAKGASDVDEIERNSVVRGDTIQSLSKKPKNDKTEATSPVKNSKKIRKTRVTRSRNKS